MKKKLRVWALLLLLLLPVTAAAQQRVFDNAQVFSAAEEKEIAAAVDAFIEETGMDFAVLTVRRSAGQPDRPRPGRELIIVRLAWARGMMSSGALYILNIYTANRYEYLYTDGQMINYMHGPAPGTGSGSKQPQTAGRRLLRGRSRLIPLVQAYVKQGIPEGQYPL